MSNQNGFQGHIFAIFNSAKVKKNSYLRAHFKGITAASPYDFFVVIGSFFYYICFEQLIKKIEKTIKKTHFIQFGG